MTKDEEYLDSKNPFETRDLVIEKSLVESLELPLLGYDSGVPAARRITGISDDTCCFGGGTFGTLAPHIHFRALIPYKEGLILLRKNHEKKNRRDMLVIEKMAKKMRKMMAEINKRNEVISALSESIEKEKFEVLP